MKRSRLRRRVGAAAFIGLAAAIPAAQACGVCVEDKVAATYDHAIVMRAIGRGQVVVFASAEGYALGADVALAMTTAALRVRGIDRASVRSTAAPLALSFALDTSMRSPEEALAAIGRGAGVPGLKLSMLKVMR